MKELLFVAALVAACPAIALAQAPCTLEGAWELESAKYDGKPGDPTYHAMKLFTATRFSVIGRDTAVPVPVTNDVERQNFIAALYAAGGTYNINNGGWTEKIDYSTTSLHLGTSVTFTCTMQGDRLIQRGHC